MTIEEVGAYIRLLCYQWGNGKIPESQPTLERVAGGKVSELVKSKFPRGKNKRLEFERKKQTEYREKQRLNGMRGGRPEKPKPNPSLSSGFSEDEPKKSSPSPSPSPVSIEREEGSHSQFTETPSWEEFWAYCQSPLCGIAAEWYAKDKYWAACQDNWKGKSDWRAYARRVRGWWDNDGRPKTPPLWNRKPALESKSLLEKIAEKI